MTRQKQKRSSSYGIGREFLRGSTWWVALNDGAGHEIRVSTRSTKESDADDLLGQKLQVRSRGELGPLSASSGRLTTGKVLDEHLERLQRLASGTLKTYRYQSQSLLKRYFGLILPAQITTDMLSNYRDDRSRQKIVHHNGGPYGIPTTLNRHVGETSINRELALLRSALRDLSKRRPGLLPSVPYFPMEREDNARQGFLSEQEFTEKFVPATAPTFARSGRVRLLHPRPKVGMAAARLGRSRFRGAGHLLREDEEQTSARSADHSGTDARLPARRLRHPECRLAGTAGCVRLRRTSHEHGGPRLGQGVRTERTPGLLFHDLRRSANKSMRDHGISQGIREQINGHRTASRAPDGINGFALWDRGQRRYHQRARGTGRPLAQIQEGKMSQTWTNQAQKRDQTRTKNADNFVRIHANRLQLLEKNGDGIRVS